MTLEQFAYLGEIIAAFSVVASLIYVAKQLGQNAAMMRVNASHERVQRDHELSSTISSSQEFAELWARGASDFESLDEIEKIRLIFFERGALLHWHHMFALRAQNLLSDANWRELLWLIRNLGGRREAILESWRMFKDSFEEPFQEFLEAQFSSATLGDDRA